MITGPMGLGYHTVMCKKQLEHLMLDEEFWNIIKNIDNSKLDLLEEDDYPEELMEPLILALSKLDEKNIKGFEEKLSEFLYALDGEIYANNAGESGESGDGFLYARCWIVAKGKKYYEPIIQFSWINSLSSNHALYTWGLLGRWR